MIKKKPKIKKRVEKKTVPMPQLAPPKYILPSIPDDVEDLF